MEPERDDWPFEVLVRWQGLALSLDGDKLLVSPAERIDDELRAYITTHRAALVETCRRIAAFKAAWAAWNRELEERPRRVIGTERLTRPKESK